MCLICVEYEKGNINAARAIELLPELEGTEDPDHLEETRERLWIDEWIENIPQSD